MYRKQQVANIKTKPIIEVKDLPYNGNHTIQLTDISYSEQYRDDSKEY